MNRRSGFIMGFTLMLMVSVSLLLMKFTQRSELLEVMFTAQRSRFIAHQRLIHCHHKVDSCFKWGVKHQRTCLGLQACLHQDESSRCIVEQVSSKVYYGGLKQGHSSLISTYEYIWLGAQKEAPCKWLKRYQPQGKLIHRSMH